MNRWNVNMNEHLRERAREGLPVNINIVKFMHDTQHIPYILYHDSIKVPYQCYKPQIWEIM